MEKIVSDFINLQINIKYALSTVHTHDWYEIKSKSEYALFIMQDGIMHLSYQQQSYTLQPGDAFLFYPQIPYHASTTSDCCRFIFIHFDVILGNNHQALHFYPFDGHYPTTHFHNEIGQICSGFFSVQKKEPFAQLQLNGSLTLFLASVMKANYEAMNTGQDFPKKSALARLQPALIYIGEHLQEPIYMSSLAACVNLSEKYFISFFKQTLGVTPAHYIIQAKMRKALEYLYERKYSVKEIATRVGYADIYTFSKAFKKIYGIPPSNI